MIELRYREVYVVTGVLSHGVTHGRTEKVLEFRQKPENRPGYPESDWSPWKDVPTYTETVPLVIHDDCPFEDYNE